MTLLLRRRDLLASTAVALAVALTECAAAPEPPGGGIAFYSFFQPDEAAFVDAAVSRLIPADASGPGAKEAGVTYYIDGQLAGEYGQGANWYMQGPFVTDKGPDFGYQIPQAPAQAYREAIAAINAYCAASYQGEAFAALPPETQDAVLQGLEGKQITLAGIDGETFFKLLLENTYEGFWADPVYGGNRNMAGWTLIGFPGARGDFKDYIEQWGKPYPLPPVSLQGHRPHQHGEPT